MGCIRNSDQIMNAKLLLLILALAWPAVTARGQDNYRPEGEGFDLGR